MFDGITYGKGAKVLRMLESFVGRDTFQKDITNYLIEHSFANADAANFWGAIASEAKNIPVEKIMRSYCLASWVCGQLTAHNLIFAT